MIVTGHLSLSQEALPEHWPAIMTEETVVSEELVHAQQVQEHVAPNRRWC